MDTRERVEVSHSNSSSNSNTRTEGKHRTSKVETKVSHILGDSSRRYSWMSQFGMAIMTQSRSGLVTFCVLMLPKRFRAWFKDSHIPINASFTSWIEILFSLTIKPLRNSWTRSWTSLSHLTTKTLQTIYNFYQMHLHTRSLSSLAQWAMGHLMDCQTFSAPFKFVMKERSISNQSLITWREGSGHQVISFPGRCPSNSRMKASLASVASE